MMRRLRVLHVISDAEPNDYFLSLAAHTDQDRFELRFASLASPGVLHEQLDAAGLSSVSLRADRRAQYPATAVRLARLMRRDEIDVVQAHLLDGCFVGLTAARLARVRAAIMTAHHSGEIPLHARRALTAVDRLSATWLSDGIIAPTAQLEKTLVGHHRVARAKVEVIHHGFELDRFDPARADGARVRRELGLGDDVVLCAIGRLHWIKNQEALVRAFGAVAPEQPDARLLVVGPGDPAPLIELARANGVEQRVTFVPRRSDVPDVLAASDLFAHPSMTESFGQVIIEAMAMARPVVSTPVGIAPEAIDDTCGVLAQSPSAESLATALRRAFGVRAQWQEMGARARSRAGDFSAAKMTRAYEDYYERLLSRRGS